MTTIDFITELYCRIDDQMSNAKQHSQANLRPSEVVTLAILFALKGVGNRASIAGWKETIDLCFQICQSEPVSFVCSTRIVTGHGFSWQNIA
jgi:hypothetical protein